MAGSALLEREIEKIKGQSQETETDQSEEEREHQRMMSQNLRDLLESNVDASYSAAAYGREEPQDFRYYSEEPHAPAVPSSSDAPSASSRMADYMAYSRSLEEMRRRSMEGERARAFENSNEMYPSAKTFAPVYEEEPVYAAQGGSVEEQLYREGVLMDTVLAPDSEPVEAPQFSPSYMPRKQEESDEDDARPTQRTLEYTRTEENENDSPIFAGLSSKTKAVLGAIAAAVILLLAIICVNTAVLRGINSGLVQREGTVLSLTEQLSGIETRIESITSPEFVENWAAEHGMTPPEP